MSVGVQATQSGVNNNLTSLAIQLRNLLRQISDQQEFVTGLGSTGLQALGFTSGDATSVLNFYSYMNTIAGVYFGTATQGTTFDFDNALSALWGGQ
jgi:hypothetical protein